MPNNQNEYLFQLIKSLSKSEKRSFKIFAKRIGNPDEMKFIQLFDAIDKQFNYNEEQLMVKIPQLNKIQLPNLKSHLYRQILLSLRLGYVNQITDIQIKEQIDYARILFTKGLYIQSLKLLEKAKQIAISTNKPILQLEIVDFEKFIEGQYITRSMIDRAEQLTQNATNLVEHIRSTQYLSNLSLKLYSLYIKIGYVKNEKEYFFLKDFFYTHLNHVPPYEQLDLHGKLHFYIAHVWYAYIAQDFLLCYRYAQKWVDLFSENETLQQQETVLYLKGYNNLLSTLYNLGYYEKLEKNLKVVSDFVAKHQGQFDENLQILSFLYLQTAHINKHFLEGSFEEGTKLAPTIEMGLKCYGNKLDLHRTLIFYYKIACLYFGCGDLKNCIYYLNKVIHIASGDLREDIQCFARILLLITHYELGNHKLVESQIKSVYRFLTGINDSNKVLREILNFLRNIGKIYPGELRNEFSKLHEKLNILQKHPYEKRSFLYLDIISWLESKIEKKSIMDIVRNKFIQMRDNERKTKSE